MWKLAIVSLLMCATVWGQPLTRGERDRLMSHLHATRKAFLDSVDALSEEQWRFKPAPGRWSVAEVAEHITLSDDTFYQMVTMKAMKSAAEPAHRTDEQRSRDAEILKMLPDRSGKAEAPAFLIPRGKWLTREELTAHFKKSRDRAIAYIRDTDEEVRSHFAQHPVVGRLDAYQWLLTMSAHTERHTKQIREVRESPGFPRE